MTHVMEGAAIQDHLDLLVNQVTPSLAHRALRGHLVHQEEATMGSQDHQGLLDLLDHPYLELIEAHRLSIFPGHLVLLVHLGCLDILLG